MSWGRRRGHGAELADFVFNVGGTSRLSLRCGKVLSLSTYAGMGMTPAELAARYREYAAQCVAVAQSLDHAREKLALLDMAQAWIALATQAEKNEKLAVVYETPEVLARD